MSTYTSIHPKYGETQTLTAMHDDVHWDNANAVRLTFGNNHITVFHLDDVTAELLHIVASMTVSERAAMLGSHKTFGDDKDAITVYKEVRS